jgi:hypothetical protein
VQLVKHTAFRALLRSFYDGGTRRTNLHSIDWP